MKTTNTLIATLFLLPSLLFSAMSVEEIVKKVDARDDGDNSIADMEMILIDKNENTRTRAMRTFTKDKGEDTHKVIFFLEPADVKNTSFLTYDYDDEAKDDDQWLYLPALKKSKRIASNDKSASFMGSDFSYSDMTSRNIEDYSYKLLNEDAIDGQKVWIIETTPKKKKTIEETGYTKSYMFVRQDNFVVIRAMHLLAEGDKRKYMDVKKLEKIDGIWIATEIEMKTMQSKQRLHTTVLKFNNVRFNQNLDPEFFTVRQIEKGI